MSNIGKIIKVEKGEPLPDRIEIFLPIKIKKSSIYALVFTDNSGKTHYFEADGSYDGWSRETNYSCN